MLIFHIETTYRKIWPPRQIDTISNSLFSMAFSVTAKFAPGALERQVDYEIVAFLSEKKNSCKPFSSDMLTTGVVLVFEQLPL